MEEPGTTVELEPQVGECVLCFVWRAVAELGCDDTLRWAGRFREGRVPDAVALERSLGKAGARCDCEIFLRAWTLQVEHLERDVHTDVLSLPTTMPTCSGVRRTSARPCRCWERVRRR